MIFPGKPDSTELARLGMPYTAFSACPRILPRIPMQSADDVCRSCSGSDFSPCARCRIGSSPRHLRTSHGIDGSAFVFYRARWISLWESVAPHYPIKKWAAAALFGAFGYLLLTGATVSTQRAFIMTTIVLLAVFVDRSAISMRLVAWAAMIVLVFTSEII